MIADVKSAVAWYQKRSPKAALDFIEELHRAADTICEAPERWPIGKNNTRRFLLWRFPFCHHLFRIRIRDHNLGSCSRQQATRVLGRVACNVDTLRTWKTLAADCRPLFSRTCENVLGYATA